MILRYLPTITLDSSLVTADYEGMDDRSTTHLIIIVLLFVVIVNLFILDLNVFHPTSTVRLADIQTTMLSPTPVIVPNNPCDDACKAAIRDEVMRQLAVSPAAPITVAVAPRTGQARESYVPLGNGSTSSSTWVDLTATDTQVDLSLYGSETTVYFTVSLRNPTQNGQVDVQLYNVTASHPVWGSHLTMNGPAIQTLTSGPITLDRGANRYRLQLKSSLGYEVFVDNARLRIVGR